MSQIPASVVTKPAIRLATTGLFSAIPIPLAALTGASVGGILEHVLGEAVAEFSQGATEQRIKKSGGAFLGGSARSIEQLRKSRLNLEAIYCEALRVSLDLIHSEPEMGYEDWFANWDCCLRAEVPLEFDEIDLGEIDPAGSDSRFRNAIERLDDRGKGCSGRPR
jgi:hypothetical protein